MKSEFKELLEKAGKVKIGEHKELPHLIPTIFNKNADENFMSDWLAFILNPLVNSVGIEPLNLLFKVAKVGKSFSENAIVDIGNSGEYSSCRERYLDNERHDRIDLLFMVEDDEKCLIAIENKIYSGQSRETQLDDYANSIEEIVKNGAAGYPEYKGCKPIKIYLTLDKNKENLKIENGFFSATHEEFITELKNISLDFEGHSREALLINEYIANMEEYIVPKTKEKDFGKEEVKFFAENYDLIHKISARKDDFNKYVRKIICDKIAKECFYDGYSQQPKEKINSYCFWNKDNFREEFHCEIQFNVSNLTDEKGHINARLAIHNEIPKNLNEYEKVKNVIEKVGTTTNIPSPLSVKSINDIEKIADDICEKMKEIKDTYEKCLEQLKN